EPDELIHILELCIGSGKDRGFDLAIDNVVLEQDRAHLPVPLEASPLEEEEYEAVPILQLREAELSGPGKVPARLLPSVLPNQHVGTSGNVSAILRLCLDEVIEMKESDKPSFAFFSGLSLARVPVKPAFFQRLSARALYFGGRRPRVPQKDPLVIAPRGELVTTWAEGQATYRTSVAAKSERFVARGRVPDLHRPIAAAQGQPP